MGEIYTKIGRFRPRAFARINSIFDESLGEAYVDEEDDVHHEGIDDGGDGDDLVVEDEGTARHGDGLGCVLHADLDDQGATLLTRQAGEPREQGSC